MDNISTTMDDSSTALTVYTGGDAGARADRWASLAEDDRKRQATAAAQTHDAAALWDLTESWLILHGRKGAQVALATRTAYRTGVAALLAAWPEENLLRPSRLAGTRWLRAQESWGRAPASVRVALAAARALYAALRDAGATAADPFKDVHPAHDPVPRWEKGRPYGPDDVERLVGAASPPERVMVLLGAHAGLRVSEIAALCWENVDARRGMLVVAQGKGGKRRTVPLSGTLVAALDAWRLSSVGARVVPYKDRHAVWYRLRALAQRAGVAFINVHALRHAAGTRMTRAVDLETASHFLGHSSIATTQIYAHFADDVLKDTLKDW